MNRLGLLILLITCLTLCACSGGGVVDADPLQPHEVLAIDAGGNFLRIYAEPGSADSGTPVIATTGATGSGTAEPDGSFSFTAALNTTASAATGLQISVAYTKDHTDLVSTAEVTSLGARVTLNYFATGSGPNDIVFGNNSLYVANSLDNSVVRYGLDGTTLASAGFPASASPSYLTLGGNAIWVVANGNNTVTGLEETALGDLISNEFLLTDFDSAFIGPGQPLVVGSEVFVPRAQFNSFGPPTEYGTSRISRLDFGRGRVNEFSLNGRNAQFLAYDNTRGYLYVVCTGELQFDENYQPFMDSSSYLEAYDISGDTSSPVFSIDLGPTGAGEIALSPDGRMAFLGNSINGNVYLVDLQSETVVRGLANPIVLTTEFTFISDVEFTPDGRYLLATSFNTDELFVLDGTSGEPFPGPYPLAFDLSQDPELLAGANGVVMAPAGSDGSVIAYILSGIANAVTRVVLF